MPASKTKRTMPTDFKSSNDTRNWCVEKYPGVTWAYCLADAAIPEMYRYAEQREAEGRLWKWADWNRTHINFIRRMSPLGGHFVKEWERMNGRAKAQYDRQFGIPERTSKPQVDAAGNPNKRSTMTKASDMVALIKARMER